MAIPEIDRPPSLRNVGSMLTHGITVRVWCDRCKADFRVVDLEAVAEKLGPDYDLWGKATHCRMTEGCPGKNQFYHNANGHFRKLRGD